MPSRSRLSQHREDRRDADAARDEPETVRGGSVAGHRQRERVTGSSGGHRRTDGGRRAPRWSPRRHRVYAASRFDTSRASQDHRSASTAEPGRWAGECRCARPGTSDGSGWPSAAARVSATTFSSWATTVGRPREAHVCGRVGHRRRATDRRREPPDARQRGVRGSRSGSWRDRPEVLGGTRRSRENSAIRDERPARPANSPDRPPPAPSTPSSPA